MEEPKHPDRLKSGNKMNNEGKNTSIKCRLESSMDGS